MTVTVTKLPVDGELLCNPFDAPSQPCRRRVAVAGCKWALFILCLQVDCEDDTCGSRGQCRKFINISAFH